MQRCSIVILNWNGRDLLYEGLPSVLIAARKCPFDTEVLVVDNGSTDGSVDFLRSDYPGIKRVTLDRNHGYGEGNNIGVQHSTGEVVVLLNNDMIVDEDFMEPLIRPLLEQDDLFAVGSQIYFQDQTRRREETGKTLAFWDKGMVVYTHQSVTPLDRKREYLPILWASGGAAAFERKKFLELGGFRSIYSPAYVEDVDLSYRALKRGWKVLFAAESIVHHKHRATSSKRFEHRELEVLVKRNQLLFLWSNVSSREMMLEHLLFFPFWLAVSVLRDKERILARAFLKALPLFLKARKLCQRERSCALVPDERLLKSWKWKSDFLAAAKRLSILFVCPYVPCEGVHGGGARMFEIIRGLSLNHDVSVLSFIEKESEEIYAQKLREFCREVFTTVRHPSFDEPDWFHTKPREVVDEFSHPTIKRMLEERVSSGCYDIVQFEYLQMGYMAKYVKKFNAPMLLTHHEVQHESLRRRMQLSVSLLEKISLLIRRMYMLNFELKVCRLFDMVVALADSDARELLEYAPGLPVRIHRTAINLAYFVADDHSPPEPYSTVFVGYYRHKPNVDAIEYYCREIFPLVREQSPQARLYVVGAEPSQEVLSLHDGKSVIVTGWVEDIRPYLSRAAVFVVPLRLGAGLRGKIIEAWAMKKAVVSTSVGCLGLDAHNGINALIADTADEFAECILGLFRDQHLAARLGQNGFETVTAEHDVAVQVRRHEQLYAELLRSRS
jgi:GT2 family glycosyltransferase/glycosyltransferase involved in cell wall biosynthesis